MAKNILVTGLVLGNETDMCSCCDINLEWLFNHPSDLLWVNKVVVTQNEWKIIIGDNDSAMGKATKLIFQRLQAEGLIRIISDTAISPSRAEIILKNIETDLEYIEDLYTESDDEHDPILKMGQYQFCVPRLWTLYAAIELSWLYNASFSLEQDELAYLLALIPRKYNKDISTGRNVAIDEVLSLYLPSIELGHSYLIDSERGLCPKCVYEEDCSSNYLTHIEKQLESIMTIRQYDEIRMTCEIMDKICERSMLLGHVLTGDELWDDLQEEAKKTEKTIKRKLHKIKRWNKISSYVSIGLGAASFLNPLFGAGAAVPAVASQCLSSYEDYLKKESSWVNFVSNPEVVLKTGIV